MIVDDSKVIRVTARKILRDHFETIEAVDGENAWDILTGTEPCALVISDLTMPNLDGFGLLERIRDSHHSGLREIPVIIITGANDTDTTRQRARECGATDFISKPFDAVQLLARTHTHVASHTTSNTTGGENAAPEERPSNVATTGLANAQTFMERGYELLSYAIRHDSDLALFRIEIDSYRDLYREYGEGFVQTVVRTMGQVLATTIRQEDTAACTDPARFALLLPAMDDSGVRNLAQRIMHAFSTRTFRAPDKRVQVTVSIGICSPQIRKDTRFEELLSAADRRLALATAQGGNRFVADDRTTLAQDESLAQEMKAATGSATVTASPTEGGAVATLDRLLSGDEAFEIEEIELSSPDFTFPQPLAGETPQATTAAAPPSLDSIIPSFDGRPPDHGCAVQRPGTGFVENPTELKSPEAFPARLRGNAPDAATGKPRMTVRDEDVGENITIIDPFSSHTPEHAVDRATGQTATPVTGSNNSIPCATREPAAPEQHETPQARKGFLRISLSLFSRFRARR